ncbi:hypothetical protein [Rhodanobacter ginsengiterrae]|uniref:hypothetical protein n=1 Tax=Rhodanobacter ginsengiterrae TaxID=2008451 RepID=UPI003CF92C9B
MRLRDLGFLLAFSTALLPSGTLALAAAGIPLDLAAWFPLGFIFGIVPLIDALVGQDRSNPKDPGEAARLDRHVYFRVLTALVLPLWLATLAWCTWHFIHWSMGPVGIIG